MKYQKGDFQISEKQSRKYFLPQIMYVPAERNFISIIKEAKSFKSLPDSLLEYITEFNNATDEIKDGLSLPINDAEIKYDKQHDVIKCDRKRLSGGTVGSIEWIPVTGSSLIWFPTIWPML